MRKKLALALGSGGARGFCHIGALEVFEENDIKFDIITGCSMGSMVAGGVVAGVSLKEMRDVAEATRQTIVMDVNLNISMHGMIKGERAIKAFKGLIGETRIEDCKIKYGAVATDLISGKLYTFTEGAIWRAVRASMSIPGVFVPVEEGDMMLADGGILNRIPIQTARDLGADVVIAVDATGGVNYQPEIRNAFDVIERAYMLMDWKCASQEGKTADFLITPDLGNKSMYRFKDNKSTIDAGKDAVLAAMPQILQLLKKEGFR